jgi:aerobic carbon-monoxide dehydrogenase medium subunit
MRPATFEYVQAGTLEEAVRGLRVGNGDAQVLAGGQILINQMRARLVRPATVVDISRLDELRYIRSEGDDLAVGALSTMADVESSDVVRQRCPALAEAAALVGDLQVRNRATVGGNFFNPDPVSDLAPVLLATGGRVVLHGPDGRRELNADQLLGNASPRQKLAAGEILVEARFGALGTASAFEKLSRRAADPAIVNAAAAVEVTDGQLSRVGLALVGVHRWPVRAKPVEDQLSGRPLDADEATALLSEFLTTVDPPSNAHADGPYRHQVGPVVAVRALRRAVERAQGR